MSATIEKINKDFIASMKAKNELAVNTLKMVKAAIRTKEIDLKRELNEEEAIALIRNQVKSRRDSIEQFEKAGRKELVEKEAAEIEILQEFLPQEMSGEALEAIVKESIAETGAKSKAEMGKVMPVAIAKAKGQAEGVAIKDKVLELLK